ncbi:MAG: polyprenyl synthetase family protein [Anaerolineae bacterium]
MTLRPAIERHLPAVDSLLRDILAAPSERFKSLYGMMQYHHGWLDEQLRPVHADSGKRVRPLLCLLCCEACGGEAKAALPVAAAVELIHSFSLVHDDIQDNSPLRRHRPTVWALWGIAHAINVGDVLYAAAHQALLRLRGTAPAEVILSLAEEFESTCVRICEGQYLDMGFETQDDVEWDDYVAMIERKTGVLMSYAAWSGATVAGAEQERAERLRAFGMEMGMAFQIQDDVLGIWGQEEETGKSGSSDIASAKKTLPLLHALRTLPAAQASELAALYRAPERDDRAVDRARELIEVSGARERCEELAGEWYGRALASLRAAQPEPGPAQALEEMLDMLARRRS